MIVTLKEITQGVAQADHALPHFNVWGYEDARAVRDAAEELNCPFIYGVNRTAAGFMGVQLLGPMLRTLAEQASVPVCVHLDHCNDYDILNRAMDSGFTSVMYDGSQLPLQENIDNTRKVAALAHERGISIEGEVGSVPYSDQPGEIKDLPTDPEDAYRYAAESGVDAMAISIGNVHRLREQQGGIDFDRLKQIQARVPKAIPLVLHGASGITPQDMARLVTHRIAKVNFGTVLRQSLGEVNKLQAKADEAVQALATGKGISLHETMIALEKADLSFRPMMEVRNKIVEAYREVLRMQI